LAEIIGLPPRLLHNVCDPDFTRRASEDQRRVCNFLSQTAERKSAMTPQTWSHLALARF